MIFKKNITIKFLINALLILLVGIIFGLFYNLFQNQKELFQSMATYGIMKKHMNAGTLATNGSLGPESGAVQSLPKSFLQPWAFAQEKARNTVVQVISQTAEINILQPYKTPKQSMNAGSAFFIKPEGFQEGILVTNAHVIEEAYAIWIKIPSLGRMIIDVELIGKAPERDLALLRISQDGIKKIKEKLGEIPFLTLGNSDCVKRTDEVLTLGYPLGQSSLKSTSGVVSGREHMMGRLLIQIDSPVNPGNSGGPALNVNGEVIGITVAGIQSAQNVGYIIPINELKMIFSDLYKTPLLRKPFLGFFLNSGSEELALHLNNPLPSGCYLIDVYDSSPLAKAGVKAGDMIYEINGISIDEYGDLALSWSEDKLSLMDYISMLEIGQKVDMIFYRNGKRKEVSLIFERTELAPIRQIFPGNEQIDYEIFGGMLIQPVNLNLIPALINNAPILTRYGVPRHQKDPALIVTHIIPNSQTQRLNILTEGNIIAEVNGTAVKTMEDLRYALAQGLQNERITFKTEDGVFFVLNVQKVLNDEIKLSQAYQYPLSSFMKSLIEKECKQEKDAVLKSVSVEKN